jgi:hypothetical protein
LDGKKACFSFGVSYGMIRGVVLSCKVPLHFVSPQRWKKHYDLIGVDPRGVASSSPIVCLTDSQKDDLAVVDSSPDSPQEVDELVSESATLRDGCAASGSGAV